MKKIVIIGSSNTDMVIKTNKIPSLGETILGGDFFMTAGGKGANQAVAAARLGGNVTFICKVGNDIFGTTAIEAFKKENINTEFISIDVQTPSGIALINVDAHGENAITVASGANGKLSKTDIDHAMSCFKFGDILLVQLEIPIETVEYAIKKAKSAGMITILNPAPAIKLPNEIFQHLDFITPNETEAELLTGIKVTDEPTAIEASLILHKLSIKNIIITLGSKGSYLKTENYSGIIEAKRVNAVDTRAAGDCFKRALAVNLASEKSIFEAVSIACLAASISVTRVGAQTSMPTLEELNTIKNSTL